MIIFFQVFCFLYLFFSVVVFSGPTIKSVVVLQKSPVHSRLGPVDLRVKLRRLREKKCEKRSVDNVEFDGGYRDFDDPSINLGDEKPKLEATYEELLKPSLQRLVKGNEVKLWSAMLSQEKDKNRQLKVELDETKNCLDISDAENHKLRTGQLEAPATIRVREKSPELDSEHVSEGSNSSGSQQLATIATIATVATAAAEVVKSLTSKRKPIKRLQSKERPQRNAKDAALGRIVQGSCSRH